MHDKDFRMLAVAAAGGDGEPPEEGSFGVPLCSEKREAPQGKPAASKSATSKRASEGTPREPSGSFAGAFGLRSSMNHA